MGRPSISHEIFTEEAEVPGSKRLVQRCMSNKILVALGSIVIVAVVAGICAAIALTVIVQQNKTGKKNPNDKHVSANQFDITTQCHPDGSVTLEFPSELVGKLTMFSWVRQSSPPGKNGHRTWQPSKICGERLVSTSRQLLKPECQYDSDDVYKVGIFEQGDESGYKIALNYDDLLRNYVWDIDCKKIKSQRVDTVVLNKNSSDERVDFRAPFTIEGMSFSHTTTFSKNGKSGYLGESVKMGIKITHRNDQYALRKFQPYFKRCILDIYYLGNNKSLSILENSTLTSAGRVIGFYARYLPSFTTPQGYFKPPMYTVKFKSFMLRNRHKFGFVCQISDD